MRQILDFSRKSVARRQPLDLVPFMKEVVKMLERTLPEHVRIETDFGIVPLVAEIDLTQMQQVVTNLAVNARDAMPEGGALRLACAKFQLDRDVRSPVPGLTPGAWIELTFSDTGTGMTAEVLEHLFEPFFTTKPPDRGTGLGLAQVHGIVQQHGGVIEVRSRLGEGTVFRLYLPEIPLATKAVREESSELPRGSGETILLVEDQEEVRTVVQRILQGLGYATLMARDGKEALQMVEGHGSEIALVLTDVVMPEMGGPALAAELRARGWSGPVVFMSGYPLEKGAEPGTFPNSVWLQKPPNVKELGRLVRQELDRVQCKDAGAQRALGKLEDVPAGEVLGGELREPTRSTGE